MSALQTKNRSYKDFHHSARLVPSIRKTAHLQIIL